MPKVTLTHTPGFNGYGSRFVINFSAKTGIPESEIIVAAIDDYVDDQIVSCACEETLKYCCRDIELDIDQARFEKLRSIHPNIDEAMRIAIAKFNQDATAGRCKSFPQFNSPRSNFLEMLARYVEEP